MLAAQPDTLQAVTVVADRGVVVSRTDTVKIQSLSSVGMALQTVPGLYLGDNGGAAGLKTVSLRGMGSAHTALYVDGLRVGNVQSGQNDLGFLAWQDLESVVVDYAQNSVSFLSARPVFKNGPVTGKFSLNGGSFGTWQPYGKLSFRLNEDVSLSAYAGGNFSNGAFPLADGSTRSNNFFRQQQLGGDIWADIPGGDVHAKLYYNRSNRGTPGSLSWPSTDSQKDRNFLAQWMMRKCVSPVYTLHLSAKGSYDRLLYISEWGDSDYAQTELQLNSVHKFTLAPWWDLSLTGDVSVDGLNSNLYTRQRVGTVWALATAFHTARLKADLALSYEGVFDQGGSHWNSLSPSADLRFKVLESLDIVAFGRRAYRTPTFNELYYPGYGNPELKPEDAWLTDLGVDWHRTSGAWSFKGRADAFYNFLTNKIISAPSPADPNVWLPYNVGKVQAFGADLLLAVEHSGAFTWGVSARYSFQNAIDKTPDSYSFGQQIPYIAKHTVVLTADAAWKGWALNALWNLRAGRKDSMGDMPNWNTLDLTAGKTFCLGKAGSLALRVMGRNLFDCRYETVSGYPMPGRSFLAGLEYKF